MAADGGGPGPSRAARAERFAALDRRLDPDSRAPLAVGVSGGSDSLALLLLVLDWARPLGRRVLALTVDHGLNPQSARWTAEAGAAARALGADWRGLAWIGPKPTSGLPAAARRARHARLAEAARDAGAGVLLLGHTADDVAESELIRRDTPSHGTLRDWAPSPTWPEGRGVFLLRPLLAVRRGALRAELDGRGVSWLEDPANADLRFARPRARQTLASSPLSPFCDRLGGDRGPGGGHLLEWRRSGPQPSLRKSARDRAENGAASADTVQVDAAGVLALPLDIATSMNGALGRAIACASGRDTPPSGKAVWRLAARIANGAGGTLGRARVAVSDHGVTVCREVGRRAPQSIQLLPGVCAVFDGRFEVTVDAPGWRVAALSGGAGRLPREDRRRLAAIPAIARPTLPAMLDSDGAVRLPWPFGDGPGVARELVSARLAAALGLIDSERALARDLRGRSVHGA